MKGREFLAVADTLSKGATEAEWRSAISRAYYAAFHAARELLEVCGFTVPRADQAHVYLWLRLSNCGHPAVRQAGRDLTYYRSLRNWADYDVARPMKQQTAIDAVRKIKDIIQLLEDVPNMPGVQTQITTAMKNYEQNVLRVVTWKP